jgi:hypothetical protein
MDNIGTTPYWAVNSAYGGAGKVVYKNAIIDSNYSQGKNLTYTSTFNLVVNLLAKQTLPFDTNGIYVVMTSR